MGTLYIVSTPIGNLGDITHRAIDVLQAADRVLAEDTRRTSVLCRRYGISTPLVSAHSFNEEARAARIIEWLDAGDTLALVSDAGTPLLSDPGARIVRHVLAAGHEIVPIPGASALLAALVGSGLAVEPFTFFGFAPRTGKARETWLGDVATSPHTAVLFEAPGRLVRLLRELVERCGPGRAAAVARELTKRHETFVRGTLADVLAYYEEGTIRGEIVIVLAAAVATGSEPVHTAAAAASLAAALLADGSRPSEVARELVNRLGLARNEAYSIAVAAAAAAEGAVD